MAQHYRPEIVHSFNASAISTVTGPRLSVSSFPQPPPSMPYTPNVEAPPFMQFPPPVCPPTNTVAQPHLSLLPPRNIPPLGALPVYGPPPTALPNTSIPPPTSFPPPVAFPPLSNNHNFLPPPNLNVRPPLAPFPSGSIPHSQNNNPHNFLPSFNVSPLPFTSCPPPNLCMSAPVFTNEQIASDVVPEIFPDVKLEVSINQLSSGKAKDGTDLESSATENTDDTWLKSWLSTHQKKTTEKLKNPGITVGKARMMLKEALRVLSDLKVTTGFLQNSIKADEDMWQFKLRKALKLKERMKFLILQFSSETIHVLRKRLKKIKSKRARLRRQRQHARENQAAELQNRECLHAVIDSWLKGIQSEVLKEEKKEELKKEADNILSEVRKKLQETRKTLEHLDVLKRLRAARLENAEKKGLKVSSESTERFEATVKKLQNLMTHQLSVYEAEEHALKVMLETEREQERKDRQQEKLEALELCQKQLIQRLFSEPPETTSPLYFYWQYQMQGHSNLDALIQIRQQWDSLLVCQDDPLGSPVPVGWVPPQPPSSRRWESALATADQESE